MALRREAKGFQRPKGVERVSEDLGPSCSSLAQSSSSADTAVGSGGTGRLGFGETMVLHVEDSLRSRVANTLPVELRRSRRG